MRPFLNTFLSHFKSLLYTTIDIGKRLKMAQKGTQKRTHFEAFLYHFKASFLTFLRFCRKCEKRFFSVDCAACVFTLSYELSCAINCAILYAHFHIIYLSRVYLLRYNIILFILRASVV